MSEDIAFWANWFKNVGANLLALISFAGALYGFLKGRHGKAFIRYVSIEANAGLLEKINGNSGGIRNHETRIVVLENANIIHSNDIEELKKDTDRINDKLIKGE
ncbi:hypothetical protein [Mycoplasma sp. P36-A1]|uniref:hypothetical protein n=1 Tax=Mycoplasma sp. P36-A1 TaxID=3252900 RepID=UPI003C2D28ED